MPGSPDLEGLDLDLALRRRPASAVLGLTLIGGLLGRKPDARTGDRIVDQAPADLRLLGLRHSCQEGAFLRVLRDAGFA